MIYIYEREDKYKQIGKEESNKILEFALTHCSHVILSKPHTRTIEKNLFRRIILDSIDELEKKTLRQIRHIESLSVDGMQKEMIFDKQQIIQDIKDHEKEMKKFINRCANHRPKGKDTLVEDLKKFGLVKRKIQINSYTTSGGIWDICYFDKEIIRPYLEPLKNDIYTYPLCLGTHDLVDIAFDDLDEYIWFRTCSHEHEYIMYLNEEQYDQFKTLGIEHRKHIIR